MRKSMKYKFARNMLLIILLIIVVLMILCNMYNILYIINFFDLKRFLTDNHFFITIIVFLLIMLLVLHLYSTKELDETDFKKNKNYYRDIINNYSISVLNYIDNFTLNYKQAYTAKLLELQKKGIIKIENNIITIINKPTKKIDIYFVESIKNNKVTLSLEIYELLVIDEAVEKDLIVKNNKGLTGFNIFIIMLISMIVAFILFFCCRMFLAPILWMFFVFVLYSIGKMNNRIYKRTEKGKDINMKLDGLKLFMEHFSNMKNKKAEQLVLWEDYLIYSVMFNINSEIQDEYSKYFELK